MDNAASCAAASDPFLFDGAPDPRFEPKERVLGLGGEQDPVAVPPAALSRARVFEVEADDETFRDAPTGSTWDVLG